MKYLESIVPHIPSENMQETIDFMVDVLDFELSQHSNFYAELRSSNHVIGVLAAQAKPNEQSIYLRVKDIDTFWADTTQKLAQVNKKAPFDREYGMREIHLIIPATNTLLFIGSPIKL